MNKSILIGITGTNGAGKGTVVEYLVKEKGFKHFSAGDLIMEEVVKRGLPKNRDSMIVVGNDLRSTYGSGYIAEELIKRANLCGENAIVESIRTAGEVDILIKTGGILLAIETEQKLRFERIKKRGSDKDNVTWDEFVKQERTESESSDPNKQNLTVCRNLACSVINNNGTFTDLNKQINIFLKKYE